MHVETRFLNGKDEVPKKGMTTISYISEVLLLYRRNLHLLRVPAFEVVIANFVVPSVASWQPLLSSCKPRCTLIESN